MSASVHCGTSDPGPAGDFHNACAIDPRLIDNCEARGFEVETHESSASALARIAQLIPPSADVTTGSSQTLVEIGLIDQLEAGFHGWRYRRSEIAAATSEGERQALRRSATTADYIVGSVNALALTGEAVVADFGGTRVSAYAYGASRVIWVVGVNKIVPTLADAVRRVRDHVLPMEAARVAELWNVRCAIGKLMIIEEEQQVGRVRLLLVDECLGF